ncbi:hypothetical protein B0H10DRAFT_1999588 [Mycena sp. CBHHK59/15]|nr:hypothetical protein B0H10DRAFT_1999588 [Mycena sp. CBHHK59/15]
MSTGLVSLRNRDPNITFYVGSDNDHEGRLFCFERGIHTLVIQTPELKLPYYTASYRDPVVVGMYITTFNFDLERIQTLIKSVVFGKSNWAYLLIRNDGTYRLVYKQKPLRSISCPAWAPLVPERDVLYTKYLNAEDREGIWNGREVDCLVGWNDRWREIVDLSMRGHRRLRGLDVTYEVVGHIVRDGEIMGIMTEHAVDDLRVEYEDRAAVYAAVAKVQCRGLIISLHESSIMIHHGKVRLLGTASVRKFSEDRRGEAAADIYHWEALASIFEELRVHPNPMPPLRCFQADIVPFIPVPSPEKPFVHNFFRMFVHSSGFPQEKAQDCESSNPIDVRRPSRKPHITSRYLRTLIFDSDDTPADTNIDKPLMRSSRQCYYTPVHPYSRQRPLVTAPVPDHDS